MPNKEVGFRLLYEQHHTMVYHIAYQYLQNQEDAEEITQDVFVQVHQSLGKFEGKSSIKTWIYRISINKSLDYIKFKSSKKRSFIFGYKSQNEQEFERIASVDQTDASLLQQEKTLILYAVINELPPNQKTAFILSKVDEISHAEIAEIMQLTHSSIESLLFRAKKTLQYKLSQKFEEYHPKINR
jgi:RNA polymerase sigma factor (sigma-70 family)